MLKEEKVMEIDHFTITHSDQVIHHQYRKNRKECDNYILFINHQFVEQESKDNFQSKIPFSHFLAPL